jgi:hypothetical protein
VPASAAPPLIATIGLHASASTWVFNVVRELTIAAVGEERVVTLYADRLDQLPDEPTRASRHVVIKSHHGSVELDAWLAAERALVFLSVRDPRDACISMTQRFKAPLEHTVSWIMNDCDRMMRLVSLGHPLLRYEDRFFEDTSMVGRVAQSIGLNPAPEVMEAIFTRYQTEQVRTFARKLEELPPERVTMVGTFKMDRVTQILAPHIGDGGSGKWYDLPARSQAELTRLFGPFLDRFGYER